MGQVHLRIDYFYSLTYRQFTNTLNGFRKYEDAKSKEQWGMTRKIMYAAIRPHLTGELNELDIIDFPWEKELRKKLFDEELENMKQREKISEDFFARWDQKKIELAGKA